MFNETRPLEIAPGLTVQPIRVSHDAEPTFAFRIDYGDANGMGWSIGYASDLGCGSAKLIEAFSGVDILALEFNHDVRLEERSRRPKVLIDRVLSDFGHLSNCQAAELTTKILTHSGVEYPSHLVQLHLSKECNRPELAAAAGRETLARLKISTEVVTARQDAATKPISLVGKVALVNRSLGRKSAPSCAVPRPCVQPSLPGFDA
jgi:phosphoribosyl 1,2-cyclic phosphodiesterase